MVSRAPDVEMWHMNEKFGVEILSDMLVRRTDAVSKIEAAPEPCGCSSLCSAAMLAHPSSVFADYLKEARRTYDELRSTTVVMANVTCPRAVEMVQYVASARHVVVLWAGPEPGEVQLPEWCHLQQLSRGDAAEDGVAQHVSSLVGDNEVDIVIDCNARHETLASLSRLVQRPDRGYLAMTESSPPAEFSQLSAELCLDMATHFIGRRDVIMDDRHIWAVWTRELRRADALGRHEIRSDLAATLARAGSPT